MKSKKSRKVRKKTRKLKQRGAGNKLKGGSTNLDKRKIIGRLKGGLGNRIFQILTGLGFADKWNMTYYLSKDNFEKDIHYKDHVSDDESMKDLQILFPRIPLLEDSVDTSSWSVLTDTDPIIFQEFKNPNTNIVLNGYFQSEKYFPKKVEINLREPGENLLKNITLHNLYFIHFRFGDYNNNNDFKLNLVDYYKECINLINSKDNNSSYFIICQHMDEAKQYIDIHLKEVLKDKRLYYDNNTNRLDTLYYISKMRGGIGVHSTFSWIGAYCIQNKIKGLLYFPKPWKTNLIKNKDYDIYPRWATIVNVDTLQKGGSTNIVTSKDMILPTEYNKEEINTKMKKYNVIFGGTVRNVEEHIKQNLENLDACGKRFKSYSVIIYENDSTDSTREILNNHKKENYYYIYEDNVKEESRTKRLAHGRNLVLAKAKELNKNNDYNFLILVDLDDRTTSGKFIDSIETCFLYDDWDMLSGNQSDSYYDIWALRKKNFMEYNCIKEMYHNMGKGLPGYNTHVVKKQKKIDPGRLIEVDSSFGAIAIYKLDSIPDECSYIGSNEDGSEISEHVPFNKCLKRNGKKLYINTSFLTN